MSGRISRIGFLRQDSMVTALLIFGALGSFYLLSDVLRQKILYWEALSCREDLPDLQISPWRPEFAYGKSVKVRDMQIFDELFTARYIQVCETDGGQIFFDHDSFHLQRRWPGPAFLSAWIGVGTATWAISLWASRGIRRYWTKRLTNSPQQ